MTTESNEIAQLKEQIARHATQFSVKQSNLDASRKALDEQKIELDKQEENNHKKATRCE